MSAPAAWEASRSMRDLHRQRPESHLSTCWLNPQVSIGRGELMTLDLEIKLPITGNFAGKVSK